MGTSAAYQEFSTVQSTATHHSLHGITCLWPEFQDLQILKTQGNVAGAVEEPLWHTQMVYDVCKE